MVFRKNKTGWKKFRVRPFFQLFKISEFIVYNAYSVELLTVTFLQFHDNNVEKTHAKMTVKLNHSLPAKLLNLPP